MSPEIWHLPLRKPKISSFSFSTGTSFATARGWSFFKSHRTAPQLLIDAVPQLSENFGAGTVLRLRASTDEYGGETLYAAAVWPGSAQDVRIAFERFDEQWWIANSHLASGDITFTYELV